MMPKYMQEIYIAALKTGLRMDCDLTQQERVWPASHVYPDNEVTVWASDYEPPYGSLKSWILTPRGLKVYDGIGKVRYES